MYSISKNSISCSLSDNSACSYFVLTHMTFMFKCILWPGRVIISQGRLHEQRSLAFYVKVSNLCYSRSRILLYLKQKQCVKPLNCECT